MIVVIRSGKACLEEWGFEYDLNHNRLILTQYRVTEYPHPNSGSGCFYILYDRSWPEDKNLVSLDAIELPREIQLQALGQLTRRIGKASVIKLPSML